MKKGKTVKTAKKPSLKTVKKKPAAAKSKGNSIKRILIVNYEFPPLGGGGGVATFDLAREWAKTAKVDVLTSTFEDLPRFEVVNKINVYRVPILFRKSRDAASFISMASYLVSGFFKGVSLCRANKYDAMNTHFAVPSGPLGHILSRFYSIPNTLSLHGGDIYDPSKKSSPHKSFLLRMVVKFILNRADRVIAQSQNTRENAIKYYSPKNEIGVIPLPFRIPPVLKPSRKEFGFDKSDFVIITIGRVVKRKSYDTLIRAIFELRESRVKLVIVGDGPEVPALKNLTNYLGLSDKVNFVGFIAEDEKYRYLASADLFALTSLHEGFGIVFMEAMYTGIPIVCTNHGGQTDFLTHGENALLLNVGDYDACAAHIRRYMSDPHFYKKCVAFNRKKVNEFVAPKVANQYMKEFVQLLQSPAGVAKR